MPKSALSPKATKIVDKVIALLSIPENAKFYEQGSFISALGNGRNIFTRGRIDPQKVHACGTECCIAGWVVYANSPKEYKVLEGELDAGAICNRATKLIAPGSDSLNLFSGSGESWPSPFAKQWRAATTRRQRAKVAVARLKHFRATGE